MRRAVPTSLLCLVLLAPGCGLAVSPTQDDGGPMQPDSPPTADTGPIYECDFGSAPPTDRTCMPPMTIEHVCTFTSPLVCFDNHWMCPANQVPTHDCWCTGDAGPGCTCTPSGWVCQVDAAASLDGGVAPSTFACGPLACARYGEYCQHDLSDVTGVPDDFYCRAYETSCAGSCSCFITPGGPRPGCTDDGEGGVTVLGGGA